MIINLSELSYQVIPANPREQRLIVKNQGPNGYGISAMDVRDSVLVAGTMDGKISFWSIKSSHPQLQELQASHHLSTVTNARSISFKNINLTLGFLLKLPTHNG